MKKRIIALSFVLTLVLIICGVSFLARGFCPNCMAFPKPLPNGTIAVLKQGSTVGAFILENQRGHPEQTDYKWFLRSDGKTTFDPKERDVFATGEVRKASAIKFGPFDVQWSTAGKGRGYVYYPEHDIFIFHHFVTRTLGNCEMAVTSARDIKQVGAKGSRLEFRHVPRT